MEYRSSVFTFLDILGFRRIVEKHSADEVGALLARLRQAAQPDKRVAEDLEMSFLTFSDCTVRAVPIESASNKRHPTGILYFELLNLVHCQYRLLHDGYFLRGSVTIGDICFDEDMVFGPALVNAYSLESEFANHPRIVVDPRVFAEFDKEPLLRNEIHDVPTEREYLDAIVKRDSDGIYFVDYLRGILSEFDEEGQEFEFLALHKQRVLEQAGGFDALHKVAAKYLWVATYHNDLIRDIGEQQFADRGFELDDFLITPDEMPLVYEMEW